MMNVLPTLNDETFSTKRQRAHAILEMLAQATAGMTPLMTTSIITEYGRDPFLVLISCLLSLRTRDTVSLPASRRLFAHATTVEQFAALSLETIIDAVRTVGFYRRKAMAIKQVSRMIQDEFAGQVPATEEGLLSLPGVGRKTAALVLSEGFGIPAICVDVHVHRIANRLGLVTTQEPHETEEALKQLLEPSDWTRCNRLLVTWGQNICLPISPRCSGCAVAALCPRIGVTKHR